MPDAPAGAMATDSLRPLSRSDNTGKARRPADKASKLAAIEVSKAVLPAIANPVMPTRVCREAAARLQQGGWRYGPPRSFDPRPSVTWQEDVVAEKLST